MNQFLCRFVAAIAVVVLAGGCHTLGKRIVSPNDSFNESTGDSWLIQYNSNLLGDQRVYVTPHRSKFETKSMGLNLVLLRAPEETVFIYYEPKKLMYNGSIASWKAEREHAIAESERRLKQSTGVRDDTVYERGTKDQTIAGLRANHYVGKTLTHLKDGMTEELITQVWVTDQIKAPPELFSFVSDRSKGLPPGTVPLRFSVESKGRQQFLMETVKAFKMNVPDSVFEIPLGYKTVAAEAELFDAMSQEIIEQEKARHPELDWPSAAGGAPSVAKGAPPSPQNKDGKTASVRRHRGDGAGQPAENIAGKSKTDMFAGLGKERGLKTDEPETGASAGATAGKSPVKPADKPTGKQFAPKHVGRAGG